MPRAFLGAVGGAIFALGLFAYGGSPVSPNPALAASLVVNSLADGLSDDSECTLREAISNANANVIIYDECGATAGPTVDTITFSVNGTIFLNQGELVATDPNLLTIDGGDVITVSGSDTTRVFLVSGSLSLVAITVADGGSLGEPLQFGGGISIGTGAPDRTGGTLTLTDTTVRDNKAGVGGGISNFFGTATLINSTVSGNTAVASGSGGGIYSAGNLALINSTVSGNDAGSGGGIYNDGNATLTNSTVTDNSATDDSAGAGGGGIYNLVVGNVILTNTIVAAQAAGADCFGGPITSGGNNLDSDGSCNLSTVQNDMPEGDVNLGPLQDNGGPAETHALLPGSDAIDAGNDTVCQTPPPAGAGGVDQRGEPRPADGDRDGIAVCDIGSFEVQAEGAEPPPELPELPDLTIAKACLDDTSAGDADFNILVMQLEAAVDADMLDCGEVMVVADLEPGTYTITELITGPDAAHFITAIACNGVVTQGTTATVTLEAGVDVACSVINVMVDGEVPPDGEEPPLPPVIIVPVDITNTNTNTNDIHNVNNNINTLTQENEQDQTNDNNQTTNVNSSPVVNIDFD